VIFVVFVFDKNLIFIYAFVTIDARSIGIDSTIHA
jgi:hypothetical protein